VDRGARPAHVLGYQADARPSLEEGEGQGLGPPISARARCALAVAERVESLLRTVAGWKHHSMVGRYTRAKRGDLAIEEALRILG
jgi:hypothetical protein